MADSVLSKAMTEDELLTAITEAATYLGWRWHHIRRSDKAIQQGDAGFPDVVLARNGRILFLELKREGKTPTLGQYEWLGALTLLPEDTRVRAMMIRPRDLDYVLDLLK
jgi:hypothetical protein